MKQIEKEAGKLLRKMMKQGTWSEGMRFNFIKGKFVPCSWGRYEIKLIRHSLI